MSKMTRQEGQEVQKILEGLLEKASHTETTCWAIACGERVLPLYKEVYPENPRPALAAWTARAGVLGELEVSLVKGCVCSPCRCKSSGKDPCGMLCRQSLWAYCRHGTCEGTHYPCGLLRCKGCHLFSKNRERSEAFAVKETHWQITALEKILQEIYIRRSPFAMIFGKGELSPYGNINILYYCLYNSFLCFFVVY